MITIRKYQTGDEQGTWDVFYSSIHQVCSNHYFTEQLQAWAPANIDRAIWQSKIQSIKPFVAIMNEKIVGYADLQDDGKIDHFFVHGDYQAQGIGSQLMTVILDKGATQARLYSEVSHTAKSFYERNGFKVIQVQHVSIGDMILSNNVMERCR